MGLIGISFAVIVQHLHLYSVAEDGDAEMQERCGQFRAFRMLQCVCLNEELIDQQLVNFPVSFR